MSGAEIDTIRELGMSYRGQAHQLRITIAEPGTPQLTTPEIARAFAAQYSELYGYAYDDLEKLVWTYRVTAFARQNLPQLLQPFTGRDGDAEVALKGERPAFDADGQVFVGHRVYDVDALGAGATVHGPAILEEPASTLIVGSRGKAMVDAGGWILVEMED